MKKDTTHLSHEEKVKMEMYLLDYMLSHIEKDADIDLSKHTGETKVRDTRKA